MEMNYFKEAIPEYYEKQVVFKLTPEKKADQARHYCKATRGFGYNLFWPQAYDGIYQWWKEVER